MLSERIFFVGGTRSGKSASALCWAESVCTQRLFVATCTVRDDEMKKRVARHRRERGASWEVLEEPVLLEETLQRVFTSLRDADNAPGVVLIDCLSAWISNLFEKGLLEEQIVGRVSAVCRLLQHAPVPVGLVSLETGLGIVPVSPLGRAYRDVLGTSNQMIAAACSTVLFISCGLPILLKGALPRVLAPGGDA